MARPLHALGSDEQRGVFGIGGRLHAEATADVLGQDAQLVAADAEDADKLFAQRHHALRTTAQHVAVARRVVSRSHPAAFQQRTGIQT